MTDQLRTLHAHADARLTLVGTLATELSGSADPHRMWADADGLLSRLAARGLEDLAGRAFPTVGGDGSPVSSSAVSDPTGLAGVNGRLSTARDYHTVCRTFRHVLGILDDAPVDLPDGQLERAGARQHAYDAIKKVRTILERCHDRLTPVATGDPCPTVARDTDGTVIASCQGSVTHHSTGRGLCEQCDRDWRPRRGLQIPAEVIEARNARRRHACVCHADGHDHGPGGCLGQGPPGELVGRCERCLCDCGPSCCPDGCSDPRAPGRGVSERCKKRRDRARRHMTSNAK